MPSDSRNDSHSYRDISVRDKRSRKRTRSPSPQSLRRLKVPAQQTRTERFPPNESRPFRHHGGPQRHGRDQSRRNAMEESEQMAEWVAQEDSFVLKQAKKKAVIRVKEGRAKPIDWLAVNLRVIDPERDPLDEEVPDEDLDIVDPEGVLEGLDEKELNELVGEIDTFLGLEQHSDNKEYWNTMKVLCNDKLERSKRKQNVEDRAVSSVADDIDRLLSSKGYEELQALEMQITRKLNSNEPIDIDYWSQLLRSLRVWKAKASLKKVYSSVIKARLQTLRRQQTEDADIVRKKLEEILERVMIDDNSNGDGDTITVDPEAILKLPHDDRNAESTSERDFLTQVAMDRQRVMKLGYVPMKQKGTEKRGVSRRKNWTSKPQGADNTTSARFATVPDDDFSQATHALYEREVARGVGENEEIFVGEEEVVTSSKPTWADKYRPRKPRYFNRVQMGYEWNKYNQTHYDHDNPPPKVVQGYKFNIFYPDLIDKSKAPTYRIEREGGRKRGQSFAPAGEDDTCLIRFIAGPPYEDLAFRIVDKEWDYSAKKERGFKSSFDKGILQLHFQLKKVYYRK